MKRVLLLIVAAALGACTSSPPRAPSAPSPVPVTPPPEPATTSVIPPASSPSFRNRKPTDAELAAIPDAVPRAEPRSLRGNPAFYTVLGKRYQVLPNSEGFRERGVASWYGPTFHEKDTSMGDAYDMYAMSAAHKTLPLPAYARVTNLANGRSVVVRINDRGPFVGNRIIDLSYTAAWKLDMIRAGTAFVDVEVLTPGSLPEVAQNLQSRQNVPAAAAPALYVQAGAFGVEANAQRLVTRLREAGFGNTVLLGPAANAPLHRVRIGPVARVDEFDRIVARLSALGIEGRLAAD
ncbi:MAG: septal ring lytic transglycosylase RlpA family protein [Steroidobacteraceae bacterium]